MAKFTKPFLGVPDGEIYPVQYEKGDEIPEELLEAAKEAGAADGKKGGGGHIPFHALRKRAKMLFSRHR